MPVDGEKLLDTEQPETAKAGRVSREGWQAAGVLVGVYFIGAFVYGLAAPLVPQNLARVGAPQVWSGTIIAATDFAALASTPVAKLALARLGRRPSLAMGLLMASASCIAFGFSDSLSGGYSLHPLLTLSLEVFLRILCGIGVGLSEMAALSVVLAHFGDGGENSRLNEVSAWGEAAGGVGVMVAAPIGQALYLRFGFSFPFIVGGAIAFPLIAIIVLQHQAQPSGEDQEDQANQQVGMFQVLSPRLISVVVGGAMSAGVLAGAMSTLSLYLIDEAGVAPADVGLMFAALCCPYVCLAPVFGNLADKLGGRKVFATGFLGQGLVMSLLMGPFASSFESGSDERVAYEAIVLALLGSVCAASFAPILGALNESLGTEKVGCQEALSAWANVMWYLGGVLGPITFTATVGAFGFEHTMLLFGASIAAYGALLLSQKI